MTRTTFLATAAVVLVVCALRFLVFADAYRADPAIIHDPDTQQYLDSAEALYVEGRFDTRSGTPETWRTPGYPAFLAGVRLIFGDHFLLAAVVVQHLAFLLTVAMTAVLAFGLGGTAALLIATTLLMTDFTTFYYVNELLTETIYTFLVTLSALLFYLGSAWPRRRVGWLAAAAATLMLATLVRPASLYLIYVLVPVLVWYFRPMPGGGREAIRLAAGMLIPWFLGLGLWSLRNYLRADVFAFATITGDVLVQHAYYMVATMQSTTIEGARTWMTENYGADHSSTGMLLAFFSEHPGAYFYEVVLSIGRTLLSPGQWYLHQYLPGVFGNLFALEPFLFTGNWSGLAAALADRPAAYLPIVVAIWAHSLLMTAGASASLFFLRRLSPAQRTIVVVALVFVGYYLLMVSIFHGASRYRLPFTPLLCVLAGYGLTAAATKLRARRSREL